jgi:hypothetical protein
LAPIAMRVGKARLRSPLPKALRPRLVVLREQPMSFSRSFVLLLLYCKPVGTTRRYHHDSQIIQRCLMVNTPTWQSHVQKASIADRNRTIARLSANMRSIREAPAQCLAAAEDRDGVPPLTDTLRH